MSELFEDVVSWRLLLVAVVVYGFAPGFLLRIIVQLYPRDDPRRAELVAELYTVPRPWRPFWVAEQLETGLFEGLRARRRARRDRRRAARTRSNAAVFASSVSVAAVSGLAASAFNIVVASDVVTATVISVTAVVASTAVTAVVTAVVLRRRARR